MKRPLAAEQPSSPRSCRSWMAPMPAGRRQRSPGYVDETSTVTLCGDRQLDFRLTPVNAQLQGTVFDVTSGAMICLDGATVQVVSGSLAGQSVTTDASGDYRFTGAFGTVTLRASSWIHDGRARSQDHRSDHVLELRIATAVTLADSGRYSRTVNCACSP